MGVGTHGSFTVRLHYGVASLSGLRSAAARSQASHHEDRAIDLRPSVINVHLYLGLTTASSCDGGTPAQQIKIVAVAKTRSPITHVPVYLSVELQAFQRYAQKPCQIRTLSFQLR